MKKNIIHDFFKKSEKQEGYLYICRTKNGHPKFKSAKSVIKVNHLKFRESLIDNDSYIEQIKLLTGLRNNDEHIQITDLHKNIEGDLEWPCWKLKNENDIIELVNHYAFAEVKLEKRQDEYVIAFEKENETDQDDLTIGGFWHASILAKFLS
jgi:restriction endonuclease S subunit